MLQLNYNKKTLHHVKTTATSMVLTFLMPSSQPEKCNHKSDSVNTAEP